MHTPRAGQRTAVSITTLTVAAVALGLAFSAAVAPAQAGDVGRPHMWPTGGNKATPNPVSPKAIRDHRVCKGIWTVNGHCRQQPYRPG